MFLPFLTPPPQNAKRFHATKLWSSKILQRPFPPTKTGPLIHAENVPQQRKSTELETVHTPKKNSFRKKWSTEMLFFNKDTSQQFLPTSRCSSVIFFSTPPVQPTTSERSLVVTCLGLQLIFESNPHYPSADSAESEMACESTHGTEKSSWKRLQVRISFAGVRCAYLKSPPLPDCLHLRDLRETNCFTKTKILTNGFHLAQWKSVKASTG